MDELHHFAIWSLRVKSTHLKGILQITPFHADETWCTYQQWKETNPDQILTHPRHLVPLVTKFEVKMPYCYTLMQSPA